MKKCEELEELIHGYIDNELVSQEKLQLESHLATCRTCQNKIKIFMTLKTTLKEKIVSVSTPVSLKEKIINRQKKDRPLHFCFLAGHMH